MSSGRPKLVKPPGVLAQQGPDLVAGPGVLDQRLHLGQVALPSGPQTRQLVDGLTSRLAQPPEHESVLRLVLEAEILRRRERGRGDRSVKRSGVPHAILLDRALATDGAVAVPLLKDGAG